MKRTYPENLLVIPDSVSTLPHSVFCLRFSCPLALNHAGQPEASKEIKVRKESNVGLFIFQSSSLQHLSRWLFWNSQNGPQDSVIQLSPTPPSLYHFNERHNEKQAMLYRFLYLYQWLCKINDHNLIITYAFFPLLGNWHRAFSYFALKGTFFKCICFNGSFLQLLQMYGMFYPLFRVKLEFKPVSSVNQM